MSSTFRIVVFATLILVGPALSETTSPVLLRSSLLLTPIETAGTGLAPEVQVRASVDERGRVTEVEVLQIEPSSDFDELFEETTRTAVSEWRYSPAKVDGKVEGRVLDFSVQFKAQTDEPMEIGSGPLPFYDPEEMRSRYLTLALEQRIAILRKQSEIAEKNLIPGQRNRIDTPHFVVVTDSQDPGTGAAIGNNLEAIYGILDGLNDPPIPAHPEPYKVIAYIFQNRSSFASFRSEVQALEWATGFYSPAGLIGLHLEMPSSDWFVGALLHEATHAWVDRHLVRAGRWLPRWLGEGLAEYVGNSRIKKGRMIPGNILRSKYTLRSSGSGAVLTDTHSGLSLDEVRRAIRKKEGLTVDELFDANPPTFYGDRRGQYYPTSWLLVHFLRHGEPEWETQQFPALLLYLAEGYPPREAFETIYGEAPVAFEERFRKYVRKL